MYALAGREAVADVVGAGGELVAEEHPHDDAAHGGLHARREVELLADREVVDHPVELADDERPPRLELAQREGGLHERPPPGVVVAVAHEHRRRADEHAERAA